ncbi:MAG: dodecin domain-containing protein [Bacteroidetes bacterium]|nr:dodecin domain-containing protein [Bacteroidota bacterium]
MASVFEYKEVVGISTESIEAAISEGLADVSVNYQVAWFEVVSIRGRMVDAQTTEYQVTLKIGCRAK